jgi:acyl-CoA thioester hydrolase
MNTAIVCPARRVESAWIDYNGHLNMAYYNVLFDQALDFVFDELGIGAAYVATGAGSCFTAEIHVSYLDELNETDPVQVSYQLLDWDEKRLHLFATMHHIDAGYLAATSEQLSLHVDMKTRRAAPFPAAAQQRIAGLMERHRDLPRAPQVGHVIGIPPEKSRRGQRRAAQ